MLLSPPSAGRELRSERLSADFCIVGGGLAGVCAAITAARAGIEVILIQDRPVLGGNASSEVRLWVLGATSHMGNNNRWALEGGVIQEILTENLWRNAKGDAVLFDALLLEKVHAESRIKMLLNTAVFDVQKGGAAVMESIRAFCSQNSTLYEVSAPLFCDASGDGVLGFLSGAAFRMGAESRAEFGEQLAAEKASGEMLGHSIYFTTKDIGRPVDFTPPSFALDIEEIRRIHRYRSFDAQTQGCQFWWIEWGGRLDTIHDSERIKWELWRVAYGVWNYIKNSGEFPQAANLALDWIGTIPGKRESRRFEGDHILTQQDIVEQRAHPDAVSFGGWAIDLHPAEGVFSDRPGCTQWHSKGIFPIPYRCLYSRNIVNLFLAGRIISATHIAFGSTRVMATCAHSAQAVGMAAACCLRQGLQPRELGEPERMAELQRNLLRAGQYIPGIALKDPADLAQQAAISASSELRLARLAPSGRTSLLNNARAMLLPVPGGRLPTVSMLLDVQVDTILEAELRIASRRGNFTPDHVLKSISIPLGSGEKQLVPLSFDVSIDEPCYVFVCLMENPAVSVHLSDQRMTGILSLARNFNRSVAKSPKQEPPSDSGIESFEFWLPERRPGGNNFALTIEPPLECFAAAAVANGVSRPVRQPNAWVADFADPAPELTLRWPEPKEIERIELTFDCDYDHPMESVLIEHSERVPPFCVRCFRVRTANGEILFETSENRLPRREIRLSEPIVTDSLRIECASTWGNAPAAIFDLRCYGKLETP